MAKRLSAKTTLETLRKAAKRRLKAMRASDPATSLRAAQQALSRDYGLESWAALQAALADFALAQLSPAERASAFLRHCTWGGDVAAARRLLARQPELAAHDLLTAIVTGDLAQVERRLGQDPEAARRKSGPLEREPLLYLAYGRFDAENAVAIAGRLLDLGADPNAVFDDGWGNPFTPLCGAIGLGEGVQPPHPQAEALADLMLARGAAAFDTQALYNTSIVTDDVHWTAKLWAGSEARGGTDAWRTRPYGRCRNMLDYLLGNAVTGAHHRRIEWLVAHGADPNSTNAYVDVPHHTRAQLQGDTATADLLARLGAQRQALAPAMAFQVAAMRLDRDEVLRLARQHPELRLYPAPILGAASQGRADVVALLLEAGTSPNVADGQNARPLLRAATSGSVPTARLLVEAGAEIDSRDTLYDATALSASVFFRRPQMIAYLAPLSRDIHALSAGGLVERLAEVLTALPDLARHRRANGRTALFHLPDDEDWALGVARVLLAHGLDPKVRDAQGLTAHALALSRGLDEAAMLIQEA